MAAKKRSSKKHDECLSLSKEREGRRACVRLVGLKSRWRRTGEERGGFQFCARRRQFARLSCREGESLSRSNGTRRLDSGRNRQVISSSGRLRSEAFAN